MSYIAILLRKTNKIFIFVVVLFTVSFLIYKTEIHTRAISTIPYFSENIICEQVSLTHTLAVEKYYEQRKNWSTSNLGSILFKNVEPHLFFHESRQTKTFVVLIWRYYNWLKKRHINSFKKKSEEGIESPLEGCSVKNCIFVSNDSYLETADAVMVHMQKGVYPVVENRNPMQRWVFLSDESPRNTFSLARTKPNMSTLADMFNWTMTYRSDSDVPVPYGRTVPLPAPVFPDLKEEIDALADLIPYGNVKQYDVLVAILISHCGPKKRIDYLNELQQYITVDVYGGCAQNITKKKSCPGHFRSDCDIMKNYMFYLAFENTGCRQYLTEKVFYHAYSKGAIPVIMGPPLEDCVKLLPPNSFIYVDENKSPKELAEYINIVHNNYYVMLSYHRWRNNFDVLNEHGFFGSKSWHLCRLCEALNYNDGEVSIYNENNLNLFFHPDISCT